MSICAKQYPLSDFVRSIGKNDNSSQSGCPKFSTRCLRPPHAPLCGIFGPNSLNEAHYATFIWAKSPTKWNTQLPESNFQTHRWRRHPALISLLFPQGSTGGFSGCPSGYKIEEREV
ncbi:DUF6783 domain-containing protein [Lachnospiraceae bacterium 45-P1]